MAVPEKKPHLKELFKTGQMVSLDIRNPEDPTETFPVEIWLRKPMSSFYEEAMVKARAKQARRKVLFKDKDSDEYVAISQRVKEQTREELTDLLVRFEEQKYRTQAYNEVLYGEEGEEHPEWGHGGQRYVDLLAATRQRYEEILRHNQELSESEDAALFINLEEDEELKRLDAELKIFQDAVTELAEQYLAHERAKYDGVKVDTLREEAINKLIETEVNAVFYQEYRTLMLYYSCRYPEDHRRLYFDDPQEIWDMPDYVRVKLFDALDDLEVKADDLKNSPSPLPS